MEFHSFDNGFKQLNAQRYLCNLVFSHMQHMYAVFPVVFFAVVFLLPGPVAQSVTCLATDTSLTADPGVASLILAQSHTFVEIMK